MIKKGFKRNLYIQKILPFVDKSLIKVLVGQRRVGKSYVMLQLIDHLKSSKISSSKILYINKEDHEFREIQSDVDLITYIKQYFKAIKGKKYLFIDEVQEIQDFHKAIKSLNHKNEYDIYLTGSNADMLSSDIANNLGGRYISFEITGLSYKEFISFNKYKASRDTLLDYIKYGSMPYLLHLEKDEELQYSYLRSIYNTILLKDVIKRHDVRNIDFLEKLVQFLANNSASLFSAKSITDYLKSERIKLSPSVVLNYLKYLDDSFFIHQVRRYDLQGKHIFQTNEKYFFNDLGLRHALIGYRSSDNNKILETLVYLELRRRGYSVTVGVLNSNQEIDFVATLGGEIQYYQVAVSIEDKKTYEREINNLLKITDNYYKCIITMNELEQGQDRGVELLYIEDFLLQ